MFLLQTNHRTEYEEYHNLWEPDVHGSPKLAKVPAKYHLVLVIANIAHPYRQYKCLVLGLIASFIQ